MPHVALSTSYLGILDAFLVDTLFTACALAMTLGKIPNKAMFMRVATAMGVLPPDMPPSSNVAEFLAFIISNIITKVRISVTASSTDTSKIEFVSPIVLGGHMIKDAISTNFPMLLLLPSMNRFKNIIYVGPWIINNLGSGDCLPYSLASAWIVMRLRERGNSIQCSFDALDRDNKMLHSNMLMIRDYATLFYSKLDEAFPEYGLVDYTVKVDGVDTVKKVVLTKAMYLYMNSEKVVGRRGRGEQLDFSPENSVRINEVAKSEIYIIATPKCIQYPGIAMIMAFLHLIKKPTGFSLYSFNGSALQRMESCHAHLLVAAEHDPMLARPNVQHSLNVYKERKMDLEFARDDSTWLSEAPPVDNHLSILREGNHYTAVVSAIALFEVAQFVNVKDFQAMFLR
jgi:hypothetical protein